MAGLWVSLLKAAEIPAYIPGEHLVDDVAFYELRKCPTKSLGAFIKANLDLFAS